MTLRPRGIILALGFVVNLGFRAGLTSEACRWSISKTNPPSWRKPIATAIPMIRVEQ